MVKNEKETNRAGRGLLIILIHELEDRVKKLYCKDCKSVIEKYDNGYYKYKKKASKNYMEKYNGTMCPSCLFKLAKNSKKYEKMYYKALYEYVSELK